MRLQILGGGLSVAKESGRIRPVLQDRRRGNPYFLQQYVQLDRRTVVTSETILSEEVVVTTCNSPGTPRDEGVSSNQLQLSLGGKVVVTGCNYLWISQGLRS